MRMAGLALLSWAKLDRFLDKARQSLAFAPIWTVEEQGVCLQCAQADRPVYKQMFPALPTSATPQKDQG